MRVFLAALLALTLSAPARADPVTVFAAASLKPVLDAILLDAPAPTRAVYAGTSQLARQIVAGAPADIFLSASAEWMAHVADAGRVTPGSVRTIATNRLVVVGPPGAPALAANDLASLGEGRLAVALTDAVPAGLYARAALESTGHWHALRPHIVETQDVRAALRLVVIGAARNAIVYASDAHTEPGVTARHVFADGTHPDIVYPAAVLGGASPAAGAVFDHIAAAQDAFARAGFGTGPSP